ncbi:MAG TPA: gephyrin-like molybdotransferase Glp [Acidobacteriaceae bacterium]|jgi:molybdopterin molybdotransferase|nr:gephyrin-like molybdotransferase Glp [Acidobacteriaceae bacterium]
MNSAPAPPILSYEEAALVVRRECERIRARPGAQEPMPLLAAAGRVLAEPVAADRDQPPFARSTRDGFACRSAELVRGALRIAGLLRAGQPWAGGALGAGEAVEIMTGAAVPPGADCVAMVEHVTVAEGRVQLNGQRLPAFGENIVPAGAEAHRGDVILPAGRRLGPAEIAAAAACGAANVVVSARPRVAVLATGDELVEVAQSPLAHQIRNSNSYSLAAQVAAAGGTPELFPIVRDEVSETEAAIRQAMPFDLILLTGGVSMGRFDYVEPALLGAGAEFLFTGVRMQPGKPVVFGRLGEKPFFGLPGNPISTMVTFALFVSPLLRALGGEKETAPRFRMARLEEDVAVKAGLTRFLPARLQSDVQETSVRRIAWQGSGDLTAAARANVFLVVPEDRERLDEGAIVSVLEL